MLRQLCDTLKTACIQLYYAKWLLHIAASSVTSALKNRATVHAENDLHLWLTSFSAAYSSVHTKATLLELCRCIVVNKVTWDFLCVCGSECCCDTSLGLFSFFLSFFFPFQQNFSPFTGSLGYTVTRHLYKMLRCFCEQESDLMILSLCLWKVWGWKCCAHSRLFEKHSLSKLQGLVHFWSIWIKSDELEKPETHGTEHLVYLLMLTLRSNISCKAKISPVTSMCWLMRLNSVYIWVWLTFLSYLEMFVLNFKF